MAFGTDLNNGSLVVQTLQTPTASIDNDLRLLFPVGKRIFDFVSYIGYGRAPHSLEVSPGPFALLLNDSLPYGKVRQDLDSRQFFADMLSAPSSRRAVSPSVPRRASSSWNAGSPRI